MYKVKKCHSGEARLKRNRLKICYPRGKHRGFDSRLWHQSHLPCVGGVP